MTQLLMSETVHDAVKHLTEQLPFVALAEVYRQSEFGWQKVASAKNYQFECAHPEMFTAFLQQQSLHRMDFSGDSAEDFLQQDSLLYFLAYLIPTRDNKTVAIILSGASDSTEQQLREFMGQLLPVLSNLYHVHNSAMEVQDVAQKYKEQSAALALNQSLLENVGDAIFYHDKNGRFLDVNQQAIISLGFSRSELLSKKVKDIDVVVNDGLPLAKILKEKVKPGQPVTIQSKHRRKDGSQFPVEVTVSFHDSGNYLAVARDISKRTEIREELEETKEFLQNVIDLSSSLIYVYDFKKDRIIKGARKIEMVLGYPEGSVKNLQSLLDISHEKYRSKLQSLIKSTDSKISNRPVDFINQVKDTKGNWRWVKTTVRVFKVDEFGKAEQFVATATEVTEQKNLEIDLIKNQNKYKALLENSFDAIAVFDKSFQISYASTAAYRMLGYDLEDSKHFFFKILSIPMIKA